MLDDKIFVESRRVGNGHMLSPLDPYDRTASGRKRPWPMASTHLISDSQPIKAIRDRPEFTLILEPEVAGFPCIS